MRKIKIDNRDLGMGATIDTYQTFDGSWATEQMIECYNNDHGTDLDYDDFEWTFDNEQIVKSLAEARAEILEKDVDCIKSVKVIDTGSPEFYNYTTDWFKATYEIDTEKLDSMVKTKQSDFDKWYKENWSVAVESSKTDEEKEKALITAKLDFVINHITYDESDGVFIEESCVSNLIESAIDIWWDNTTMERIEENGNA